MALFRAGLRAKLLLAFGLVLLPVAVLLWAEFHATVVRQEESLLRNQLLTAQAVGMQVDQTFDALIGYGWAVADDWAIRAGEPSEVDAQLRALVSRVPQVALIAVYDARGVNVGWGAASAASRTARQRRSIAGSPEFQQVMALNLPQISNVLPADRLGRPGLVATVPVRDSQDQPIGVVVVGALTDDMARRYEHARLLPGQAIMLADRTGRLAFHTARGQLPWRDTKGLADSPPLRAALAGIPTTQRRFIGIVGGERLSAFVPTPKYRWAVGVTVPRSIALAPVHRGVRRQVTAFAGILLVTMGLAGVLARYLVTPVRRLEEAASALGRGDLTRRVNLHSRDELGRLGRTFDQMAVQLGTLYQQQRQVLRLREEFMEGAAHELKTPISTIVSALHLLGARARSDQDQRALEIISRQARRMASVVEDLITVSRLEAALPAERKVEIDLERMCDDKLRRVASQAPRHQFHLSSPGPVVVPGDVELVGVVLERLLENAVDATPEGGTIDVAVARTAPDGIVTVRDQGPGISPDRQAHVFEPFYEAVPSGRPGYVGIVSVRLHLCRRILDAHGGRIWVTSQPPAGATFGFALPVG